jgi:hypothetical protein
MSIRVLAFALLIGASLATAAPPKSKKSADAPPTDTAQSADAIDVDALARSKDVDAAAQSAAGEAPPSEAPPSESAPSDIPPADAVKETPAAQESAPAAAAPEAAVPEQAPAEASAATPAITPPAADAGAAPANTDAAAPEINAAAAAEMEALSIASSCRARATSLLDDAEKGHYGEATSAFDAKMRTALPAAKFKEQWESLAQFGKLTARGQSHLGKGEGYTIVIVPLIFEKANLLAQIACGSDGRVAGFHVTPAERPQM